MSNFPWTSIRFDVFSSFLEKDELFWQRHFCREFSRLFYTPFDVVEKMPFEKVYRNVMEHNLNSLSEEKIVESIRYELYGEMESPEEKKKLEEQIDRWVAEDAAKRAKKKSEIPSFSEMRGAKKFVVKNTRTQPQKESDKGFPKPVPSSKVFDLPPEEDQE